MTVSHSVTDTMRLVRESRCIFLKMRIARANGSAQFEISQIEALRGLANDAIRIDAVRLHFDEAEKALYIEALE